MQKRNFGIEALTYLARYALRVDVGVSDQLLGYDPKRLPALELVDQPGEIYRRVAAQAEVTQFYRTKGERQGR